MLVFYTIQKLYVRAEKPSITRREKMVAVITSANSLQRAPACFLEKNRDGTSMTSLQGLPRRLLPQSHTMLHYQTDGSYCNPAYGAEEKRFSAGLNKFYDVAVQSDGSHCGNN